MVEPTVVEPIVEEPTVVEPIVVEPTVVEPKVMEPSVVEPSVVEPTVVEPSVVEPSLVEPTVVEPIVEEPSVVEPTVVEPSVVEPIVVEPKVMETTSAVVETTCPIMLVCYYTNVVFFLMTSALPVYFASLAIVAVEGLTEPPLIVGLSQVEISERVLLLVISARHNPTGQMLYFTRLNNLI